MAYTVQPKKARTFDFDIAGYEKTYHVPVMSALPVNTLKKAEGLAELSAEERGKALYNFVTDVFRETADDALDILKPEDLEGLFAAYIEASNTPAASAGE